MFKTKKSLYTMIAVTFLMVTVLISCSPSKPTPQFTLRIGTFSAPSFLPYFVMQEQGFDKKNGLQLVLSGDGCGDAWNEWSYTGRTSDLPSPGDESALYVGLYRQCYCPSWHSGGRNELHSETFSDGRSNKKSEGSPE